jgi:phosphoribosylglycinamide formyltransferase-1
MRLLSPWFVQPFHRILNIHPSLLPAFPGLEAQEQAFAYGVKVSGCTVHFGRGTGSRGDYCPEDGACADSDDSTLAARIWNRTFGLPRRSTLFCAELSSGRRFGMSHGRISE